MNRPQFSLVFSIGLYPLSGYTKYSLVLAARGRACVREFTLGRGVQFGQYFYGRPYLSGTVDANGRPLSQ